ncbi:MAG TPA: HEAT repeat domain-containing protein [Candidatus Limnocylindria bacterium]|nr:HEAT repeat domain-containing protein [Candidatus Limnocylindria bacterium]
MTTTPETNPTRNLSFLQLSASAQAATRWFRQLARTLKTCRLYRAENAIAQAARDHLFQMLSEDLSIHGLWAFRVTSNEIFLGDEPVVRPAEDASAEAETSRRNPLPFQLYRDGVRGLAFQPGLPRHEFEALFEALLLTGVGPQTQDDLVTLLWQANTVYLQIEAVPAEQTIYLSSRRPTGSGGGGRQGLAYAWSPSGAEIRADLGQVSNVAQGLHRDSFDDWHLPEASVEVPAAYQAILPTMQFARTRFLTEWASERATPWSDQAPELLRLLHGLNPTPESRNVFAHAAANWLAGAIQSCAWDEAQRAFALLREFDPDGSVTDGTLAAAISALDSEQITEQLDESEAPDQAQFSALAVGVGQPALDLACAVMAYAQKSRTRAAACTMLCYLCNDHPELLAPYLADSRWYVVRNTVFVLGQIGGPGVVSLLRAAAFHPEPRVRRQVVQSLGSVPADARRPILIGQLDTRDPQLLAASLNMLARQKDPEVASAILHQVEAPDFESRNEENQRALFGALGEVAGDEAVPALEALLHRGGWFARRTLQRVAAARTLQRIGTPKATAALQAGVRSRSEAVRSACLEGMAIRSQP